MKKLFITILLLTFTHTVLACDNINFYDDHRIINDLPVRNQGALNTCYAQTLSTVYNLEFAKDTNEMIEPFWVAFIHKIDGLHWSPRKLDYSLLSLAWNDLKKNGYCDISYVRPEYERLKKGVKYSDDQLFYLLTRYFKAKNLLTTKTDFGFYLTINKLMKNLPGDSEGLFELPWKREEIIAILYPIRADSYGHDLFGWLEKKVMKSCKDNAVHKSPETLMSVGRSLEKNDSLALVTEALLAQKRAVSVGFCGKILSDPTVNITITPRLLKAIKPSCGAHYITLVGSRKTANSCQYLIRNSHGKGFWAHKDYTCFCKDNSTGKNRECVKAESSNPNLEVLGCWIDRDKLLTNAFDISYFKK